MNETRSGTSTGALIAIGLTRGLAVAESLDYYRRLGPLLFSKAPLMKRAFSLYRSEPIADCLRQIAGSETTVEPEHLRCRLLVVTRNASTDSPWPISSNPNARFNQRELPDCNLSIPLWKLGRASTAAPIFFPPQPIEIEGTSGTFNFVDGATTSYNSPAFLLFRMATLPEYRLGWATGESQLLLVSIGTGETPDPESFDLRRRDHILRKLRRLPSTLIRAAKVDQDISCRIFGRCVHGARIDSELGDMIPRRNGSALPLDQDLGRAFLYVRYNVSLSVNGMREIGMESANLSRLRRIDCVGEMEVLSEIDRRATDQVDLADFGTHIISSPTALARDS